MEQTPGRERSTIFFTGTAAAIAMEGQPAVSGANWNAETNGRRYTLRRHRQWQLTHFNFGWIYSNTANTISYTGGNSGLTCPL